MSAHGNLLPEPSPTLLPTDPASELAATDPAAAARRYPVSSIGWALLAEQALTAVDAVAADPDAESSAGSPDLDLVAYAYARTGYHRGLDALRKAGWKGFGPVPWEHEPNRGFLRALAALAKAAERIGDEVEADRCRGFLAESSATAAAVLDLD